MLIRAYLEYSKYYTIVLYLLRYLINKLNIVNSIFNLLIKYLNRYNIII